MRLEQLWDGPDISGYTAAPDRHWRCIRRGDPLT